jgi:dephospho-CoA kinase
MKELRKQYPDQWIVYEAALLIESGRAADFQGRLLLVTADEQIRIQRLMKRNGKTRNEALMIIRSQMPDSEKRKWATWEITNNGDLNQLAHSVLTWMSKACSV